MTAGNNSPTTDGAAEYWLTIAFWKGVDVA